MARRGQGLCGAHIVLLLVLWLCASFAVVAASVTRGYCWGDNGQFQAGQVKAGTVDVPTMIDDGGQNLTYIAASANFTCSLNTDGKVHCWGQNDYGQLGDSTSRGVRSIAQANQIDTGSYNVSELAVGIDHACAVYNESIYCWGSNAFSILGADGANSGPTPRRVGPWSASNQQLRCGSNHTCCYTDISDIYCWGNGAKNMLGDAVAMSATPVKIPAPSDWTSPVLYLSVGEDHACAINTDKSLYCWGSNEQFQLGSTDPSQTASEHSEYTRVSCGKYYTCAVDNPYVVPGGRATNATTKVTGLPSDERMDWLVTGANFACGRTVSATYCWGLGSSGALGINVNDQLTHNATAITGLPFVSSGSSRMRASPNGQTVCELGFAPVPVPDAPFVRPIFNEIVPQVTMLGVESGGAVDKERQAMFKFAAINEVFLNGTVQSYPLTNWTHSQTTTSSSSSAAASLAVDRTYRSVLSNGVTVDYTFEAYTSALEISVDPNFTLPIGTGQLKFTLRLSSWPWVDPSSSLRFHIGVQPDIQDAYKGIAVPKAGMTSFSIDTSTADLAVVVRLVDFALVNGSQRVDVSSTVDVASSALTLTIGRFDGDLTYDPDFGLLLTGGKAGSDGGDDNLGLIVGVSVAIPVAVAIVLLVVVIAFGVWAVQKRRARSTAAHVNFSSRDGSADHDDRL